MDCGPSCLKMVAEYYGKNYSLQNLRVKSYITRAGVSMLGISDAAEAIGFRTMGVKASLEKMVRENPVPFIAHWGQNHFVVVYKMKAIRGATLSRTPNDYKIWVADPAHGLVTYSGMEFSKHWASSKEDGEHVGVALLLEPTPDFYEKGEDKKSRTSLAFLKEYLRPHKKFMVQISNG